MKKGNEYNGVVERVEFGDKGIVVCQEPGGENDGKLAVVKNCIEGQKIVFRVRKKRSGKAEGDLVRVLEESPLATATPACPHFGLCGSCRYQMLPYEAQLSMKERQIKDILDGAVKPFDYAYEWQGIVPSPLAYEYRNKMEFSFGNAVKDGPLTLGLHKKGSFYDIMEVTECRIVDADFRAVLTEALAVCREYGLGFYHKMTHVGYLRHLLVRKAAHTGEMLVDLVTSSQAPEREAKFLKEFTERVVQSVNKVNSVESAATEVIPNDVRNCAAATDDIVTDWIKKGTVVSVLHTVNDSLSDTIQNDRTDILYGRDYIEEILLGLHFYISAFSFFQTNSKGAERLYEKAREFVGETKDKIIYDLYSGTGTIAQLLAPVAKKVIGVEIIEEAVEAAKENAKKNGLDNCDFLAGDVLKMLDEITEKPDFIVLDPPRDGIHPKALAKIIDYGVDKLLYISCKPTSLARDLATLQEEGYCVEKAAAVDMFAQTYHCETICLLKKAEDTGLYRNPEES